MVDVSRRADPDRPIADDRDAADLDNGYTLAWAVDPDGERWPWLVAQLCQDCERSATHGDYDAAAHERAGQLPREYRERLGLLQRCGATTWHGEPCRRLVPAGTHCRDHIDGGPL